MLEFIRNRAQGFFAWLIVGLIILVFGLFGINQYLTGGGDTSVAKVNGEGISQVRLESAYNEQRQRLAEMFGGELPPMFTETMLKQQVLSQLVAEEVMVQAAYQNGMRVSDSQLASIIRSAEVFQEGGAFSQSQYERLLANRGLTPGAFESRVRRDILAAQFASGFRDTAFVTKAEEDYLLRLQNQQRTVGYLQVALGPFETNATVSDEEVEQFYQSNQQRFMQPERVKIDYLELDARQLMGAIEVDEEALRTRYEARKINYTTPEERRARHILLQVPDGAPEAELEAAREKAESLLSNIRGGADFAELAKSESDDPGSAANGGDLGFFGRGTMVPEFEEAAYGLEPGQVSDVVRSPFGFHIIKLVEVRGGEVKPFAEVKESILKEIRAQQAEERFYDMAERLANLTYEHPDSLQLASEELGLAIQTSDYFSRQGGSGIASNPKVTGAAFSDEVLVSGHNSETIELARNHLLVLRINDHQPEQVRPLEEVREAIISAIKHEKARGEAEKLAASLHERVQAGEDPAAQAEHDAVTWHPRQSLLRDNQKVNPAVVSRAFSMPAPAESGFSSDTLALRSGDQAVVVLYAVDDGDPAGVDEAERMQVKQQLLRAESNAVTDALMSGVRSRMDISIKQ